MSNSSKTSAPTLKVIQGGASRPAKAKPPAAQTMPRLRLRDLAATSPKLTREAGLNMAQAASVVLQIMDKKAPITMAATVQRKRSDFGLVPLAVTDAMLATHADMGEATHYGAYGVAILLARDVDRLTVVRKSNRGQGVDWWFSNDPNLPFTHRVEVSGIYQNREGEMKRRVTEKVAQSKQSDGSRATAIVVVVDFCRLRVTYWTRP